MSQDPAHPVLVGTLYRERGQSVTFATQAPTPRPAAKHRPASVARMLALAHHLQRLIDARVIADRADAARRLGFTRARISQLLDLLLLAPDLQAVVLALEAIDGLEPLSERALRRVAALPAWAEQRAEFTRLQKHRAVAG